jgi:hypothetical protein
MTRTVSYHWRLRQVMAEHDLWKTTDLVPLLAERGGRPGLPPGRPSSGALVAPYPGGSL